MPKARYSLFIIHYSFPPPSSRFPPVLDVSTRFDLWTTAKNIAHSERLKIACLSASRTSAYRREFRFLASNAISFFVRLRTGERLIQSTTQDPNASSPLQKVHLSSIIYYLFSPYSWLLTPDSDSLFRLRQFPTVARQSTDGRPTAERRQTLSKSTVSRRQYGIIAGSKNDLKTLTSM